MVRHLVGFRDEPQRRINLHHIAIRQVYIFRLPLLLYCMPLRYLYVRRLIKKTAYIVVDRYWDRVQTSGDLEGIAVVKFGVDECRGVVKKRSNATKFPHMVDSCFADCRNLIMV